MRQIALNAKPLDVMQIDGVYKIALVDVDKNNNTCLYWSVPKNKQSINAVRRYINNARDSQ